MLLGNNFYYRQTSNGWIREAHGDSDVPPPRATDWHMTKGTVAVHENRNWDHAVSVVGDPDDVASFKKSKWAANWRLQESESE